MSALAARAQQLAIDGQGRPGLHSDAGLRTTHHYPTAPFHHPHPRLHFFFFWLPGLHVDGKLAVDTTSHSGL